jgi:hypothetical protein
MTQSSSDFPSNPSTANSPSSGQAGSSAAGGRARRSASGSPGSTASQASSEGGRSGGLDIAGESQKLVGVGRRMAGTWLDSRKESLTQTFTSTAEGLRRLGDSYGDQPNIRSYIEAAADGLETVSEELNNTRIEDLARHAESFSRNYPVTVFAGAVAAGLVVSRILRSAAEGGFEGNGPVRSQQAGTSAQRRGSTTGRSRGQPGEASP